MFDFRFSSFSATSAMTAAAAGVFVGIIAPLTGGLPKAYEIQEFRSSFAAFMNGEASAESGPAFYPRRNAVSLVPAAAAQQQAHFEPSALPEPLTLDGEVIEVAALPEATTISDGEIVPVSQSFEEDAALDEGFIIEAPRDDEMYQELEEIDLKSVEGVPS
jgi:hypothetical protein